MKYFFVLYFTVLSLSAVSQSNNCILEKLYLENDILKWQKHVDSLKRISSFEHHEQLLFAEYGLIGFYLANNNKQNAAVVLVDFEKRIQKMLKRDPNNSTYLSFDVALTSYKVNLTPWKAMVLGPQASAKLSKALHYKKSDILTMVEHARSLSSKPSFVGGDKYESVKLYEKAFDQLKKENKCNWLYYKVGYEMYKLYGKLNEPQKADAIERLLKNSTKPFNTVGRKW